MNPVMECSPLYIFLSDTVVLAGQVKCVPKNLPIPFLCDGECSTNTKLIISQHENTNMAEEQYKDCVLRTYCNI